MLDTQKKVLSTVDEVVKAFRGPTKLADWAGHGASMVTNWVARGYIPPGWHYRLSRWAAQHGYEISPRVFGEDDDPRPSSRDAMSAHA